MKKAKWIIDKIYSELPEFKQAIASEEDIGLVSQLYEESDLYNHPYTIVEDLNWFLMLKVKSKALKKEDKSIIQKVFKLIDKFLVSEKINSDKDLLNLIQVGILEAIVWESGVQELAERHLSIEGLKKYEEYKKMVLSHY